MSSKECYRCKVDKPLTEFKETDKPSVLRIKSNLGRVLSCNDCTCPEVLKQTILSHYPARNRDWWKD